MADPTKPTDPPPAGEPEETSIGEQARKVAGSTDAAVRAIGKKLRDGLTGQKSGPDPNLPATVRRWGKDMGGLLEKVTERTGRGMKKVAGQVVDGVKTAVDQVREPKKPDGDA